MSKDTPPRWDQGMQRRLARGEAAALGELYDRFAPLVHHTARRVLEDQGAADLVTREVFEHVWENPGAYDPRTDGSLRAWIARLARRRAVRRLRRDGARALAEGGEGSAEELERRVRRAAAAARADYIVTAMPESLRTALESAYFQRRDYRQTAAHLGVTEEEARRRLRLGLQLLATARTRPPDGAAPGPWGPPL
ncbi:sigma-70 family RNA polymerase sigma factor [Streptomyces sudanensis]|uniref:sigma-70 family RNA polymerase sigma factor n=1 Tax=Streptomyces sudanensis TaxID=436397 RepID=UPI0020CE767F|nr:sigma-70 family RNA polymerase sigma factor [Streptomyces sudanensis]MCP9958519.1 sigma-70 family RNA polymerase sigma factor [Streptomyces sudanensis]MCP9987636.1 sigma-70 family RNA polymerase sigma factor [Streptomyces sudanensis]MCQ0000971.1 sigma-70 family RNA polymerase sigma factor [Streptomyces sudanensis]